MKENTVEFLNFEDESLGPLVSPVGIMEGLDIDTVKISPDQQRILLLGFNSGRAWLLDRTSSKTIALGLSESAGEDQGNDIVSAEFSPEGRKIVTGRMDG